MNRNLLRCYELLAPFLVALILATCAVGASSTEKLLHHFQGGNDGAVPLAGLVADQAGNLYGTTFWGGLESGECLGDDGCGTVFQLKPPALPNGAWSENVIYRFGPFDHPSAGLIIDREGNLYGTTAYGGPSGDGIVFQLKPPATPGGSWSERTLYNFAGGDDGATPLAALVFDSKGNLYGTTQFGGGGPCAIFQQGSGCGTVFELTPPTTPDGAWSEAVLYSFAPYNDYPMAGLVFDPQGNLYGTTTGDQTASFGTVFQLTPPAAPGASWTQTTLHTFGFVDQDGVTPYAGLILDRKGNIYGTTSQGGAYVSECLDTFGCGTVFELESPANSGPWTEKILYNFANGRDGAEPENGLIFDRAGNLYGVTGGPHLGFNGTVFSLVPPAKPNSAWTEITLHVFGKGNDGYEPGGALIFGKNSLIGTTSAGGGKCSYPSSCGIVFEIVP
jgi:uncharacterized repeat protein (TIGR03803 family)